MTYDENIDFESLNDAPPEGQSQSRQVPNATAVLDQEESEQGAITLVNEAEIDKQIATAKKYPRSIKMFRNEALQMATLTEDVASECIYALPRDGKTIEGPSARFAEILASAWRNCRAGSRPVGEEAEFVVCEGAFYDLERNVAINYQVKRRITDKKGRRYKADMIGTTANAGCSIALRNAVLKGIPKALWVDIYEAARRTAVGDQQTLVNRRAKALEFLQKQGATEEMVLALLGVPGVEDITLDHLVVLKGLATAIKEGDTTVEQAFATTQGEDTNLSNGAKDRLAEIRARRTVNQHVPANPQQPPAPAASATSAASPTEQQDTTATGNSTDTLAQAQEAQRKLDEQREQIGVGKGKKRDLEPAAAGVKGVEGLFGKK